MSSASTQWSKALLPIGAVMALLLVTIFMALGAWAVHCL